MDRFPRRPAAKGLRKPPPLDAKQLFSSMTSRSDEPADEVAESQYTPPHSGGESDLPMSSPLQHRPKVLGHNGARGEAKSSAGKTSVQNTRIEVLVPPPESPWEYVRIPEDNTVDYVIEELARSDDEVWYKIAFVDGREKEVSFEYLLGLSKGATAIDSYNRGERAATSNQTGQKMQDFSTDESVISSATRKHTRAGSRHKGHGDIKTTTVDYEDEDDEEVLGLGAKRRRTSKRRITFRIGNTTQRSLDKEDSEVTTSSDSDVSQKGIKSLRTRDRRSIVPAKPAASIQSRNGRVTRSSVATVPKRLSYASSVHGVDGEELDEVASDGSESNDEYTFSAPKLKSKRLRVRMTNGLDIRGYVSSNTKKSRSKHKFRGSNRRSSSSEEPLEPSRRSGRTTKTTKSMKERLEDEEMFADETVSHKGPQVASIRELFNPLPSKSPFRIIHNKYCDVCRGYETHSSKGPSPLIFCQGCTTSIHRLCLGFRSTREHIVTKVAEQDFVLQCRRCIGTATKKDFIAPRLDICQICREPGEACEAFSQKKTPKQEQKLRDENGGNDPINPVEDELLNNARNVLFRCSDCQRAFHFEHLPPRDDSSPETDADEDIYDLRLAEYCQDWKCKECQGISAKIQSLVAWRPANIDTYISGQPLDLVLEDEKEYLVKWENLSYFRCTWMPGAWVWGVTVTAMRAAFARRDEGTNSLPKMRKVDAIPEEFLRIEIVLDVKYTSRFHRNNEETDRARINDVEEVYVKFQGLGYDEVVWERPPDPTETERWADFVAAYNEYVAGKYFQQPRPRMNERIEEFRSLNFERKVLLKEQPACLTGGKMMPYQMEGLNWLLYNFHESKNVILADEMGLGKTIQVIATIATLVMDKPKCWPFLVVVPNSTCPNWRREIKKWAPSLRVVAYYGLRKSRDVAMKYELYPDGCSDMRAHVVVTSYDAPVDDHSRSFFHKIKWAGMIVDEGQRLKNDKNLLYSALKKIKVPFRVLLTGTPLQNNKRELFNLLQFLDSNINASELDEKYTELTNENLTELHELIRPFFLRRTKVQVLKFLPPMAQVIVPVTMSVVQKKLYKSILAKSPELIRSIFVKDPKQLRVTERGSLNNILMQLRKVLCHPFIYSTAIEERSASQTTSHRNLVDASAKLQLLEIMLPKLHKLGHRVLIFTQFLLQLDIIEDFLSGLELSYQRLDGSVGSLEKQKRIDAFNAPDSPHFAFLLSTRAGGVGINLATADTVLILDPDFNPHQDIQALSRAHRIGQKKKVLVFQFMTKDSAEEKIVQIGRKKMALDHALIESMDADDNAGVDLRSILQHGAQALFDDDDRNDIRYDSDSVDKLLDRSQVENTNAGDDKSAESQFSFARVWANDVAALIDDVGDADSDASPADTTVWTKILKQREADTAREAAAQQKTFGRGKRMRQNVDYGSANVDLDDGSLGPSPEKPKTKKPDDGGSDTDFAVAIESGPEDESDSPSLSGADPELKAGADSRPGISKNKTAEMQIGPGMRKKTFIKSRPPTQKIVSGQKSVSLKKNATLSKTISTKKGSSRGKVIGPKIALKQGGSPQKNISSLKAKPHPAISPSKELKSFRTVKSGRGLPRKTTATKKIAKRPTTNPSKGSTATPVEENKEPAIAL